MKRIEYPRPNFVRNEWMNLNGIWDFAFDDDNIGHKEKWYIEHKFDKRIEVPFCFQSLLSGIGDTSFHDHVWYKRKFEIADKYNQKRVILHIGACDYESEIYINKELVTKHIGGNSSFNVDITNYLNYDEEEIVIYAYDPSISEYIPRGKQYWKEKSESIWYTRTTGIWQTVWIEFLEDNYIDKIRLTPCVDMKSIDLNIYLNKEDILDINIKIFDEDKEIINYTTKLTDQFTIDLSEYIYDDKLWSPENPYLFDIEFNLIKNDNIVDHVKSYFGMRKIHHQDGLIYLNNKPYFQKLVLDQGYYEKGLLTAPSDDDLKRDIILSKEMGFNGCRKHQKVEDPRFFYYADKLGYLVWGEMANSPKYSFDYVHKMVNEWIEVITRDYNHPSIVAWVPLNESWGVPEIKTNSYQLNHALTLYHLTHSLDNTRLVVSNDGWEQTKTDICAIHNYQHGCETDITKHQIFEESLSDIPHMLSYLPAAKEIYVGGFKYEGEPIMLTEFGGISFKVTNDTGWGYTSVNQKESFLKEYKRLIDAIHKSSCICGFCYTQLTDVFQEINGLLSFDRNPKVDLKKIKEINDSIKTK